MHAPFALMPASVARTDILVRCPASRARDVISTTPLAIGKEGQNARLAAKLTGARIDIQPDSILDGDE